MSKFPYKPRAAGSLKEATSRLIEACGGLTNAAEIGRVGRTTLFKYSDDSDEHAERFIPADMIRVLEAFAGAQPVTEFLAHEAGCLLLRLPPVGVPDPWASDLAVMAAESAEVFRVLCTGLEDDGEIDAEEAGPAIRELDKALAVFSAVRNRLAAIRDGKGSP